MSTIVLLLFGGLLLLFGRKLFWLFVAVAGFLIGFTYLPGILGIQSENAALITGLICGLACGVLAVFIQKIAVGVAGFAATGFLAMNYAGELFHTTGDARWVIFVAAGIVGAVLVHWLFDWALIVISSFVGATLIDQALHIQHSFWIVVLLAAIGIVVQARMKGGHQKKKED
ncbi:MAG: DUF4203 domain-containing protein [Bacteroidota bacterium]